jgi:hypothetical protein
MSSWRSIVWKTVRSQIVPAHAQHLEAEVDLQGPHLRARAWASPHPGAGAPDGFTAGRPQAAGLLGVDGA